MSNKEEEVPQVGLLLDLSLRCTGWVVVRDEPLSEFPDGHFGLPWIAWGEIPLTDTTLSLHERIGQLGLALDVLLAKWKPVWIAAEMPAHAFAARGGKSVSNATSVIMQQRAFGATYLLTWLRGVPFLDVDPSLSKYATTGKPKADKKTVSWCLGTRFGVPVKRDGKFDWPKGATEAVRDALAVTFYINNLRLIHGISWLDICLAAQSKPPAQQWYEHAS